MTTAALADDLRDFSTRLFERTGGLVEWDSDDASGTAIVPTDVAQLLRLPETFSLVTPPRAGGLSLSLATDFLDQAGHLLEAAIPRVGHFAVGERYLKRGDPQEAVDNVFGWQNARVRVADHGPELIEYHTWWFSAALRSDDVWEDRFAFTINSRSLAEVSFPDPLNLTDAHPRDEVLATANADLATELPVDASDSQTFDRAQQVARQRLLRAAASFIERSEAHRQRDQKRLRDYYHALLRETRAGSKRAKIVPTDDEKAARERAVDLELRRKLNELDERYVMEAILRPIILIRTSVPTLAVELNVQRKQAARRHTVFWNSVTKTFEPFLCSRCQAATFAVVFTNETVQPLCRRCGE